MIDRAEVLRYLKAKSDEGFADVVDWAIAKAETLAPQHVVSKYDISEITEDGVTLSNGLTLSGRLAANSLSECESVLLITATLTLEADKMLSAAGSAVKETVLNSALSAAIESYLDDVETALIDEYTAKNLCLTPRFSPGYADLPLSLQHDLLKLTNAEKLLGIHLTDNLMLVPVKSVTAIIGVSKTQFSREAHKCDRCEKPCIYKKL